MGVPKFFRWQSERYPCISEIVKENQIPEYDNLYLDMNDIIHKCTHPQNTDVDFGLTEEQMFKAICHYIEVLFRTIKPRKVFFMAVDGVAPRAKMNQQRGRRFRNAKAFEEREKKGETLPQEKMFDSYCINPGTGFMTRLHQHLKYFVNARVTEDSRWQGIQIILSGHEAPGEGEHKIMDFIRAERVREDYDPNTRHCLCGHDADLIMLGLASHEPHFSLLRENDPSDNQAPRPPIMEETTFRLLHLSLFREYLEIEFGALKGQIKWFNLENIIDDWVLLEFLVGNDFIPHLPDLHISEKALPLLYQTYIEVLPELGGYLNGGGYLNLPRFERFMKKLSKFEKNNDKEDPTGLERRKTEYYSKKMGYKHITTAQRSRIVSDYIQTIQWILHYYYNGLQSWSWYYPHHYSPYMSDLKDFTDLTFNYQKGEPFLPFQQLLALSPPARKKHVPQAFWPLMLEDTSPIREYYPLEFEQDDLNGKLQARETVVLLPFIDEVRLLEAMRMYDHKLTPEEKNRNMHGPHLMYTTDRDNSHTYPSSFPLRFPDIPSCIAKCEPVSEEAVQIEISCLKKGLLEGVRLGVYFPDFPTLHHFNFQSEVMDADGKVFQQLSVNPADPELDAKKLAEAYLGESVYAEWPHFKEVKVVAVSDGKYRYEDFVPEIKLSGPEVEEWKGDCQLIEEEYREKGVNIRWKGTKVLLYACPLLGRRYVCGKSGNMTLEKQWTVAPVPFAYHVTIKDLHVGVHDPSSQQFKTLEEIYPVDSSCFMLGMPHYGCHGKVVSTEKDSIQVFFTTPNEPNLDNIKANQSSHAVEYHRSYSEEVTRLGLSSDQVKRLAGSVRVKKCPIPRQSDKVLDGGSFVDIGLKVRLIKKEKEVPGFTRRTGEDKFEWVYSLKLLQILEEYLRKFPAVWILLSKKHYNDPLYEDEMFRSSNYTLDDVKKWIGRQQCSKAPKRKAGAPMLDLPIVKLIQGEVEQVKQNPSKKEDKLSVRPNLLFRPMNGMGNLIPDLYAIYQLFDRVINIREGFTVPLGLRGVVIGIQTGATFLDTIYDIVFDEPFEGALELRCAGKQGYPMPPTALINITYGQRKFKGQQKKTTAVVNPQAAASFRPSWMKVPSPARSQSDGDRSKTGVHSFKKLEAHGEDGKTQTEATSHIVRENRERRTVSKVINKAGGTLKLERYKVYMEVPPGALGDNKEIRLELLEDGDTHEHMKLDEDEFFITWGMKLSPSGLKFKKPIRIHLPHNIRICKTLDADVILYSCTKSSNGQRESKRTLLPNQANQGVPNCIMEETDLDLYIDNFCEKCLICKNRKSVDGNDVGKYIGFTAFKPTSIYVNEPCKLRLHIHDKLPGILKDVTKQEKDLEFHPFSPTQNLYVEWNAGDVNVKYQLQKKDVEEQNICPSQLRRKCNFHKSFDLLARTSHIDVRFKINLKWKNPETIENFVHALVRDGLPQDACVEGSSVRRVTSISHTEGSHGPRGAEMSPLKTVLTAAISTDVSDLEIIELTKRLGNNIRELGNRLGFKGSEVLSFDEENRNNLPKNNGTYRMLIEWNKKGEATRDRLIEALQVAGEGKLAKILEEPETDDVCTKMVDKFGAQLFLEAYDITLTIPPGAIVEEVPVWITLRVLTDTTLFSISDEDSVASFGFECTSSMPSSNLRFKAPVTITLPHCAVIDDDSPAEAGIYYGERGIFTNEIKSIERIQFKDSLPRCTVQADFIIILSDHFSCGLPFFRGLRRKKLGCCPFLPKVMPEPRTPVLRVYVYHHVKGNRTRIEGIVSLESEWAFHKVHPEVLFIKERNRSDMTVEYKMGETSGSDEISYIHIREVGKDFVDFLLDFTDRENAATTVILKQQNTSKKFIFNTNFPTSNLLRSASSSGESASGTSLGASTHSAGEDPISDQVSEVELYKLSRRFPHGKYHEFAHRLDGLDYEEADRILSTKNNDYKMAIREVLAHWKSKTGGSRVALRTALRETGVAHIATQCLTQDPPH